MRKFYLLLAEWREEERSKDMRAYRTMTAWFTKEVDPGDIFPSLRKKADADGVEPEENVDDAAVFSQIVAPFEE